MDGIAFDPCHKCDKSISCVMCELYMRRNGLLQRTSDEQIFDGEMPKYYSKQAVLDTRYEGNNGLYDVEDLEEYLERVPTADVVPRAECEKWYHEYHKIKDELRQEKEYHRATEKAADKYFADLQTAKAEVAREIFEEIENIFGKHMLWYRFTEAQYQLYVELKNKYTEGTDGKQA